jgi:hypothetical protein
VKLTWQGHGGNPTGVAVERRIDDAKEARGTWKKIASLAATASDYSDAGVTNGQHVSYRVRAINGDGESAYSNIARTTVATK